MDIEQLQSFCAALPSATEDIKWENNLVYSVGGKMFCIISLDGPLTFAFKVREEEFEVLGCREGAMPAPYLARARWVLITLPERFGRAETERLLHQSYHLVKSRLPKKVRKELGLEEADEV